ncbi:MAG: FAD-linked oxidase C-terminal domain-containing protein [Acidobacteriota bacterium]
MGFKKELKDLASELNGDLLFSPSDRLMYATDASEYREIPLAVARPKDPEDIKNLVRFALKTGIGLIPRAAGTSLAGQVVGKGIVVDIGKFMDRIFEVNTEERWVRVEPGVVLDELNIELAKHGLFFGPETATSSRCMLGGMAGNNSCGSRSLIYGSTRDHIISMKVILADGSEAEFGPVSGESFDRRCRCATLEASLYKNIRDVLGNKDVRKQIRDQYPRPDIKRRNTGYAIDILADTKPFGGENKFNFSKLLAGSEGTLAFTTELKLNLVPLPPAETALVCAHFTTLKESVEANLVILDHEPRAVELIDKFILDCTKDNIEQRKNRFFLSGDPGAILIVEFGAKSRGILKEKIDSLEEDLKNRGLGYHFPVVSGKDTERVWALRKAGLGVIHNIPGDFKPVSVIEDTTVHPEDMMNFINDLERILEKYKMQGIYHGHISTGELHLRPMINLKDKSGVELFRAIAGDVALIVKKYRGSLSGEHGDGRVRSGFIPKMIGEENYELLRKIKKAWDPKNIFNPGKIIDPAPMDSGLRYEKGKSHRDIETYFDFSGEMGFLRAVEKCNGSADCRKSSLMGGIMCPSFMATGDEKNTTRARANILREFITNSNKKNIFDHKEIKEVLDLCLSCKGCKSECPSSVDMAKLKAEFMQQYYNSHRIPLRSRVIGYISTLNRIGSLFPPLYNFLISNALSSGIMKKAIGFAPARSIPLLSRIRLKSWNRRNSGELDGERGKVYLFADEFTDYNDTEIGIKAITVLRKLGYKVVIPKHVESGRTFLSKGLVKKAAEIAKKNIELLKDIISEETLLVGIEPSAILTFRDEYPELSGERLKKSAEDLGRNSLMFDEFITREYKKGKIDASLFTDEHLRIRLHGHCHQKSLASTGPTKEMLSLPRNYSVDEIPSGCCGMAGSFGFEKEHYDLSMKIGEMVLFPAVRETSDDVVISAPGTSCRQQIKEGTGRTAYHPIEIFYDSLK